MDCNKKCYTELSAQIELSKIRAMRKKHKWLKSRRESRVYFCKQCNAWHLTSRRT